MRMSAMIDEHRCVRRRPRYLRLSMHRAWVEDDESRRLDD